MRIIGLAGWSGSGKTTLITKVLPVLIGRGRKVSTLKHAHHGFDLDKPGKDSFMHRASGATEVIISSERRWAVLLSLYNFYIRYPNPAAAGTTGLVVSLIVVCLLLVSGWKGWEMVYRHRVGIADEPPIVR
jgi:molybdopterin-guanine dinucleotide biosynthesis protein B